MLFLFLFVPIFSVLYISRYLLIFLKCAILIIGVLFAFFAVFCCLDYVRWTSRRPAPAGFRPLRRCCRFLRLLKKDCGLPQKTGDIRQVLRIPHRSCRPAGSARFLSLRRHKGEKKLQWPADNIRSCVLLFVHKTQWNLQSRQVRHRICFRSELHSLSQQSGN